MVDSSSDEDLPLAQRPVGGILMALQHQAVRADSDSGSEFPSWLAAGAAGQKGKQVVNLTDSDSDDAVLSPSKPTVPPPAALASPAGNRDVQQPATQQTQEKKPQTATKATAIKTAAKPKATPRPRGSKAAAAALVDAEAPSQGPATQPPPSQPPGSQLAAGDGTAQKRAVGLGLPHVASSRMALVMPEKLPQMKMLIELESSPDDAHHVTDLSGDSGAIGRMVIAGSKDEPQMQIDLKGVLYHATVVPCPVSIAVIKMGQSEAKVECLFSEFVQLREDTRFSFVDTNQLGGMDGGDDDDDLYVGGPDEAGDVPKKKGRGKAVTGAAAAKPKAAPRKRAAPKAKGGVKKAGAKPRAKAKKK